MAHIAFEVLPQTRLTTTLPVIRPQATAAARRPLPEPQFLLKQATAVHPIAVGIPIAAFAWFVIAAWIAFAGDGDAAVSIFVVGFINVMLIGLLTGGGWYSRNMTPEREIDRSFADFVRGRVDTATGRITGREALLQIAAMPVILAIGGTIIIAIAVWCGVGG